MRGGGAGKATAAPSTKSRVAGRLAYGVEEEVHGTPRSAILFHCPLLCLIPQRAVPHLDVAAPLHLIDTPDRIVGRGVAPGLCGGVTFALHGGSTNISLAHPRAPPLPSVRLIRHPQLPVSGEGPGQKIRGAARKCVAVQEGVVRVGVEVEAGLEVRDVFHLLVVPGLDLDGVRLGGGQVVGGRKAHAKVGVILKTNEMGVCTSKSNRTDHGSKKDKGQEEMHSGCGEGEEERALPLPSCSPPSPPRIQRTPKLFKAPTFPRDINLGRRCMVGAICTVMPGVRLDRMLR